MSNLTKVFNKLFDAGFDADSFFNQLEKGKTRYKLAKEGALEKLDSLDPEIFEYLNKKMYILIVGSTKCGDTITAIPGISELSNRIDQWHYRIVNKYDFEDDFSKYFQVGSKRTVPQIFFANSKGQVITKWIEKSTRSKKIIQQIKSMGLDEETKLDKMRSTDKLQSNIEVKEVINELIQTAEKAIFYR